MFDLETLFTHLKSKHQIKVKEYIDLYIGPIGKLKEQMSSSNHLLSVNKSSSLSVGKFAGPASVKKKLLGPASVRRQQRSPSPEVPVRKKKMKRVPEYAAEYGLVPTPSGRVSDPSTFNSGEIETMKQYNALSIQSSQEHWREFKSGMMMDV